MSSPKEIAEGVLEGLIKGNTKPFRVASAQKIGSLSAFLELFYDSSFVSYAQANHSESFLREFAKFHNCATSYGYRGYSEGKRNGIVDIKPSDTQLLKDYQRLLTPDVVKRYNLDTSNLTPVKVVAHVPNGNRVIGVLDKTERGGHITVVLLGMSNYGRKLKY